MPACNAYLISSSRKWRCRSIALAREFFKSGEYACAREHLRHAVVLTYVIRTAKRELRAGHDLETPRSERQRKELDAYLAAHARWWRRRSEEEGRELLPVWYRRF